MVEFTKRVEIPVHVLVRELDGESVLLNLETEVYFGLDATGTRMLELASRAPSVEAAYQQLLEEFDVEPGQLRTNMMELLGRLIENGLLRVVSSHVGSTPAV